MAKIGHFGLFSSNFNPCKIFVGHTRTTFIVFWMAIFLDLFYLFRWAFHPPTPPANSEYMGAALAAGNRHATHSRH